MVNVVKKTYCAAIYSWRGLLVAYESELAFRLEVMVFILSVALAILLARRWFDVVWLVAPSLLVMIVELLNTSVEAVIDRISLEHHPLSAKAKDTASAAVCLTWLVAAMIWVAYFI